MAEPVYISDDSYNFLFDFDPESGYFDLIEGYNSFIYDNWVVAVDKDNPAIDAPPDSPSVEHLFPRRPLFTDEFLNAVDLNVIIGIEAGYDPDAFLYGDEVIYQEEPRQYRLVAGPSRKRRSVGAAPTFEGIEMEPFPFDPSSIFSPIETYATWQMAWWREVLQNSVDAIKERERRLREADKKFRGHIKITYDVQPDLNTITIHDNGVGMSKRTLFNALLRFGGTGKRSGGGTTGGFGKAKELIFVPWLGYEIETTHWDSNRKIGVRTRTKGRHFDRQKMATVPEEEVPEITGPESALIGTSLTVFMGNEAFDYEYVYTEEVRRYEFDKRVSLEEIEPIIALSHVSNLDITINGKKEKFAQGPPIRGTEPGGALQRPQEVWNLPFGGIPDWSGPGEPPLGRVELYLDKKAKIKRSDVVGVVEGKIPVRQNGLFMFYAADQSPAVKGWIRIECSGSALAIFTDNRDGLKSAWLITDLVARLEKDGTHGLRKTAMHLQLLLLVLTSVSLRMRGLGR